MLCFAVFKKQTTLVRTFSIADVYSINTVKNSSSNIDGELRGSNLSTGEHDEVTQPPAVVSSAVAVASSRVPAGTKNGTDNDVFERYYSAPCLVIVDELSSVANDTEEVSTVSTDESSIGEEPSSANAMNTNATYIPSENDVAEEGTGILLNQPIAITWEWQPMMEFFEKFWRSGDRNDFCETVHAARNTELSHVDGVSIPISFCRNVSQRRRRFRKLCV